MTSPNKKVEPNEIESVTSNRVSQADNIVKTLTESGGMEFFIDQKSELYALIWGDAYNEVCKCSSSEFRAKVSKIYWDRFKKTPQIGSIRDAFGVIHGHALHEKEVYTLENRVKREQDSILYDLTNESWNIVEISADGWQVEPNRDPEFKREVHNKPQVIPVEGGDIKDFLKFVNMANKEDELLLIVHLVSCFIPGFPHPIAYFYGPQGSAKSTMSRLLRSLVDPSHIEVSQIPDSERELDQLFEHHWLIAFDNVSFLGDKLSDSLCKAVTGVSSSKRKLYTDDEYVIYRYQRCIVINGINLLALKPDLLERSILFELERIDKTNRLYEDNFWEEFEKKKPELLGAIFTIISKAIRIKETIVLERKPRMADFAIWGYAIAEAIDGKGKEFLCSYENNLKKQTMEVLYEHPTASSVLAFMENKESWTGTASELLNELHFVSDGDSRFRKLPETANALSRSLAQVRVSLEEAGIYFSRKDGKNRSITLARIAPESIENIENKL